MKPSKASSTWPLASYQPIARPVAPPERHDTERPDPRRRKLPRMLRSLLKL
jgi:hypothetical protein